jgi:hypothetical protein
VARKKQVLARLEHASQQLTHGILDVLGRIPETNVQASSSPDDAIRKLGNTAAAKAALISGGLALPPGPLGWLTIVPDLMLIWRIQAQLVADIAALYGKSATLSQEQMLYCLFKHAAAQAVRDLVMRVGNKVIVRRATLRAIETVAQKVGVKVTQRAAGSAVSRLIPIVGAVGVGAYAYYDTAKVARTARDLFKGSIELGPAPGRS